MANTIKQSFNLFKSNLEITNKQVDAISNCRKNLIKTFADSHISLHENKSRVIGSYDRSTLIRPLKNGDVDLLIILHYSDNKDCEDSEGTIKILDKFKYILDKKYKTTTTRRDRNCITMHLSTFKLDVIPALRYVDGSYRIPDSIEKKWIKTNPIEFAKKITEVNKNMNYTFIPLIKMIKCWNKNNGDLLNGYHIECMMYARYKSYSKGYTFDSMIKEFFIKLPDYLGEKCFDPIMGGDVSEYLGCMSNDKRLTAIKRAKKASKFSQEAFNKSKDDKIQHSIELWKYIFGDNFPSFG